MRATVLLFALLASALLLSGCAVTGKSEEKISAACERQLKELSEQPEGNTPTAKTSEDKMDQEDLHECAGQVTKADAANEEGDKTAAEEDASKADGGDKAPVLDAAARELFSSKCGSCHTLADAKTNGSFGPNLDDLAPDQDTVRNQIENGGGGMPPKLLEGDDADKVAEYVANAAGASS